MWASLRRPRALLLCHHLQYPIRRRATGPPPLALGAASRGHAWDASDGDHRKDAKAKPASPGRGRPEGRAANRLPASEQKHLYLVLKDTKNGFAFHKVGMDDDPNGEAAESGAPGRLPEPPVLRVEHLDIYNFAALGRNIIGIGAPIRRSAYDDTRDEADTLTFDTRTAALAIMPDVPEGVGEHRIEAAVPVGNMLYVIENGSPVEWSEYKDDFCTGGLHCLKLDEQAEQQDAGGDDKASLKLDEQQDAGGGDKASSSSKPSEERWSWWDDPYHSGRWTRHGDWELPFVGQAHYDAGLRAWVGLHGDGKHKLDGYLCACDVPRLGLRGPVPGWKLGKEKLFLKDPERHVDAKLVDMGGGGRFCLVEILLLEAAVDSGNWLDGAGDKCMLRLTTFRVKYGDDGELTTTARQPTRSYTLPKFWHRFGWQAFWM
uniref:Uncharacterized protein n=1 Tax=Setaria viridis TaxID=4556 RepID=A0A4U6W1Z4_SETVI|nr:hypothetical protein SEVIR_2G434200v2 [Setaria viridis]